MLILNRFRVQRPVRNRILTYCYYSFINTIKTARLFESMYLKNQPDRNF
jgi:hypothetical protein